MLSFLRGILFLESRDIGSLPSLKTYKLSFDCIYDVSYPISKSIYFVLAVQPPACSRQMFLCLLISIERLSKKGGDILLHFIFPILDNLVIFSNMVLFGITSFFFFISILLIKWYRRIKTHKKTNLFAATLCYNSQTSWLPVKVSLVVVCFFLVLNVNLIHLGS